MHFVQNHGFSVWTPQDLPTCHRYSFFFWCREIARCWLSVLFMHCSDFYFPIVGSSICSFGQGGRSALVKTATEPTPGAYCDPQETSRSENIDHTAHDWGTPVSYEKMLLSVQTEKKENRFFLFSWWRQWVETTAQLTFHWKTRRADWNSFAWWGLYVVVLQWGEFLQQKIAPWSSRWFEEILISLPLILLPLISLPLISLPLISLTLISLTLILLTLISHTLFCQKFLLFHSTFTIWELI